jgi:acyl dehydratase
VYGFIFATAAGDCICKPQLRAPARQREQGFVALARERRTGGCPAICDGLSLLGLRLPRRMPVPAKLLYLEDLSVGQTFTAGPVKVCEADILAFAKQFDPQPFHTDPEAAKNTVFKGLAASGWHTMALTMRMIVDCAKLAGGVVGFGGEISWPGPVRPGDELSIECEILAITPSRSKPMQAVATLRTVTKNQNGETVQVLTSKNLVFRRGHAPGETA